MDTLAASLMPLLNIYSCKRDPAESRHRKRVPVHNNIEHIHTGCQQTRC